jgi:hypothetical protein
MRDKKKEKRRQKAEKRREKKRIVTVGRPMVGWPVASLSPEACTQVSLYSRLRCGGCDGCDVAVVKKMVMMMVAAKRSLRWRPGSMRGSSSVVSMAVG